MDRNARILSLVIFLLLLSLAASTSTLLVGSFNIKVLGASKLQKSEIRTHIRHVFQRYDVLFIQEIRDIYGHSLETILEIANEGVPQASRYNILSSRPLGRTNSKEQYAYLYKPSLIEMVKAWVIDGDEVLDFERPPFCISFRYRGQPFLLVGAHLKPSDAIQEMNSLVPVYKKLELKFPSSSIILMGDFNADCKFVPRSSWPSLGFGMKREASSEISQDLSKRSKRKEQQKELNPKNSNTALVANSNGKVKNAKCCSEQSKSLVKKPKAPKAKRDGRTDDSYSPEFDEDESSDSDSAVEASNKRFRRKAQFQKRAARDDDGDFIINSDDEELDSEVGYDSSDDDNEVVVASNERLKPTKVSVSNQRKIGTRRNATYEVVELARDPFIFLLPNGVDTTCSLRKSCALDRVVTTRKSLKYLVPYSWRPFYYPLFKAPYKQRVFKDYIEPKVTWITNSTLDFKRLNIPIHTVLEVSDHFPIEFQIEVKRSLLSWFKSLVMG